MQYWNNCNKKRLKEDSLNFNKCVGPNKTVLVGKILKNNKRAALLFGTLEYVSLIHIRYLTVAAQGFIENLGIAGLFFVYISTVSS